jgi:hypothetical protein
MSVRQRFILLTTAAAAVLVVGGLALAGCSDGSASKATSESTSVAASSTRAAPAKPASATDVARSFVEAYGAFDADQALTYLTEDALATGAGGAGISWGTRDGFRLDVALSEAQGLRQMVTGCDKQGVSAAGTAVRCDFDLLHAFRSEEIGRGPFTDNYWDLVVRDGKITSAVSIWAYLKNGFSAEMWAPFKAWVASTHPLDVQVMYLGGTAAVTEESIALWEQRLWEWVESVKASSQ